MLDAIADPARLHKITLPISGREAAQSSAHLAPDRLLAASKRKQI